MGNVKVNKPLAYLVTFTTYGSWLHGEESGSIWKDKKKSSTVLIKGNVKLKNSETMRLKNEAVCLNFSQRECVLEAMLEVCRYRNWKAYVVCVLGNHVHAVVNADAEIERVMADFKSYSTRLLKRKFNGLPEKLWTRHGSTRYLWSNESLASAIKYVKEGQGNDVVLGGVGK